MADSEYPGPQLPDGFGFNPGELIPSAPTVFPGEQDLIYLFELAGEYFPGWIGLVFDLAAIILELIDELVALFSGKPRAQDTLTVASRLSQSRNLIGHLMSVQISRNLSQNNIVLSSSSAADQTILGEIRGQAKKSLITTGVSAGRADAVIDDVWSMTTSATQALPVELARSLPTGFTMVGPSQVQTDYVSQYNKAITDGKDPYQAAKIASQWIFANSKLGDLGKIVAQPNPPPVTPPPPPAPPPPPPTMPQPCTPVATDQDDLLTQGLNCVSQNLNVIEAQLAQLQQSITGQGATADPVTCTQLTTQVALIVGQLQAVATAIVSITPSAGTPIDLSGVVTQLETIATGINALPTDADKNTTVLVESIGNVATAITQVPPVDLSHLNIQADSQTAARANTAANLAAQWAAIQQQIIQYGVQP